MGIQKYFLTLLFIATSSVLVHADTPQLVDVPIDRGYIPVGFDDNDRSELTITGVFSNTCYKVGSYQARVDESLSTITIQQSAYYYSGVCLQIKVPYSQRIDLGILKEGSYTVKDQLSGKVLGNIAIARAKSETPDDYLYAPVTDAFVQDAGDGKHILNLRGNFTDRCTKLKEVRVNYFSDVIVVQPIATHEEQRGGCGHEKVRFQQAIDLKDGLTGSYMIHVRVMDGQALNRFTDF